MMVRHFLAFVFRVNSQSPPTWWRSLVESEECGKRKRTVRRCALWPCGREVRGGERDSGEEDECDTQQEGVSCRCRVSCW